MLVRSQSAKSVLVDSINDDVLPVKPGAVESLSGQDDVVVLKTREGYMVIPRVRDVKKLEFRLHYLYQEFLARRPVAHGVACF